MIRIDKTRYLFPFKITNENIEKILNPLGRAGFTLALWKK